MFVFLFLILLAGAICLPIGMILYLSISFGVQILLLYILLPFCMPPVIFYSPLVIHIQASTHLGYCIKVRDALCLNEFKPVRNQNQYLLTPSSYQSGSKDHNTTKENQVTFSNRSQAETHKRN
ncbi:uncharacterized protein BDW43DRAFT_151205 [Aspergillus alliaceus]|uniref:uncharacterized protein n=1 Tax=Petromyces alliaceus TaxID=209559 RepID=UPI0012A6BC44|nr:uncharacterized protein BDW43DRAFT_151205 [Aspergillus alliaceus]KAB8237983.1 hypothetical protein BDW43DRAFT_151205 [Aspergillus alliaceus]